MTTLALVLVAAMTATAGAASAGAVPAGAPPSATATPLSPLWRAPKACPFPMERTPETMLVIDHQKRHLMRLDAKTGKQIGTTDLPKLAGDATKQKLELVTNGVLIMSAPRELVAIDVESGKALWSRKLPKKIPWGVFAVPVGKDLVVQVSDGKQATIDCVDLATGAAKWHLEPEGFASGYWLGGGPTRLIAIDQAVNTKGRNGIILRLDPADGHVIWKTAFEGKALFSNVHTVGEDLTLSLGDAEIELVDGATGKLVSVKTEVNDVAGAEGRAYVAGVRSLRAFEIKTGKELWNVPLYAFFPLVIGATASVVYVHDDELLREVDPATGKTRALFGKGPETYVNMWPMSPLATYCDNTDLVALDPAAPPVAEEAITVEGTVTCPSCESPAPVALRIAESEITTDAKGHFTMTTKVRGKAALMWKDGSEWHLVRMLEGKPGGKAGVKAGVKKRTFKLGAVEVEPPPEGD